MPNPQNCTGRDFSMYDAMDDEQLRQILRDDASKIEGEDTDMELMFHIMEVLARRRREANADISPEEALERFNEKYRYTDNSLISEERPTKPKSKGFTRLQKWVATIAAILVLVFGSTITAQALGLDLWEIFVKWTQETFHFSSTTDVEKDNEPEKEDSAIGAGLMNVLEDYHVPPELLPTYLPEGYTEADVDVKESPRQRVFSAIYERNDDTIRIRIADFLDSDPLQIEQSDDLLEMYSSGGIDFYIFSNYDQLRAVWINGHYECCIIGNLSISEMKEIIDSIKKG